MQLVPLQIGKPITLVGASLGGAAAIDFATVGAVQVKSS
jgi:surfactin synthase thioesterase subunit